MSVLKGTLGWKGERGYSAYEIAVQEGYIGNEEDWLATLGTSSHFSEDKVIYTATAGQTVFDIPDEYQVDYSFLNVYVEGFRLNSDEYSINTTTMKATLDNAVTAGTKVELVVLTMSTNNLPIVTTIDSTSTNDSSPGAKAVYDFVGDEISDAKTALINDTTASSSTAYSSTKINTLLADKLNTANVQTLTGTIASISSGDTVTSDIPYPTGFTQANTLIVSKMCSSNNNYYDTTDSEMTGSGFPCITMVALTDSYIRVWMKNTNNTQTRNGYYKISIMRLS